MRKYEDRLRQLEICAEEIRKQIGDCIGKSEEWKKEANWHEQTIQELKKDIFGADACAANASAKGNFRIKAKSEMLARNLRAQMENFNELLEQAKQNHEDAEVEEATLRCKLVEVQRKIDDLRRTHIVE